jgi:exodeoxyribonuclease V alpha subunit
MWLDAGPNPRTIRGISPRNQAMPSETRSAIPRAVPPASPSHPLGRQFAACLSRLDGRIDPRVAWAARLVCEAVAAGRVCLRLEEYAGLEIFPDGGETPLALPPLPEWLKVLRQSRLVGEPGQFAPLILDREHRLYLARYWHYEKTLADRLLALARSPCARIDRDLLRADLDLLFAHNRGVVPDRQKLAAAVAVLRRFCVISGGPGTGKTSTVVRILAALQSQAGTRPLRIALAAPTGKAAARLKEAIGRQKADLDLPESLVKAIPDEATTLHRLLGARPNSIRFRHHGDNPLPVDVLVVDEASMIDLALMAKLVDALPDGARLILLGDKDQLAAVEAGSVFGDLCASAGYSADFRDAVAAVCGFAPEQGDLWAPPLSDCVALLDRSYRFGAASGIGELARFINRGESRRALAMLAKGAHSDLAWLGTASRRELLDRMEQGYREFFEAVEAGAEPRDILRKLDRFRVLTAHREGDSGVQGVNRAFEERRFGTGRPRPGARWYPGRPVIVTRNDYDLRLFNGDIGVALGGPTELRVYFEDADGRIRGFAPSRLPEHETVYAMTVHKSQGSEFDEILLLLPDGESPILDRPLVYTALTRARHRAEIRGSRTVLDAAIRRLKERGSGLAARLEGRL